MFFYGNEIVNTCKVIMMPSPIFKLYGELIDFITKYDVFFFLIKVSSQNPVEEGKNSDHVSTTMSPCQNYDDRQKIKLFCFSIVL